MGTQTSTTRIPVREAVHEALRRTQDYFRRSQHSDGYWCGELETNATMEAEYLMLCYFLGRKDRERWRKVTNYILSKQREDGSWGQYYQAPGDLSTSVECYFALKLAGYPADSEPLRRARRFIMSRGGVPKVRVFTKVWLALFGQWDWRGTPNMPPEMIFLPSWVPFNLYEFASWARATMVPMLLILTHRPSCSVPASACIDEIYPQPRSETDYSLPKPKTGWGWAGVLHRLDRIAGLYRKFPVHPLRARAEKRLVDWILCHQEADGCWAGIQPPWVYSLIALHHLGFPPGHPVMEKGYAGFEGYAIEDEDTCMVQACMSPVWDTCLAQQALLESGVAQDDPMVRRSTRWLLEQQILTAGDWQVRAKNTQPGGWSFEFHNDQYPDIDDASEVVMALTSARLDPATDYLRERAIGRGVEWLLALQSKSGGWAAFDKDNGRKHLSMLPFSDFGETLDPPSADVTAHLVEMFGRLGYDRHFPALRRAYAYLRQEQEEDGSWFGRWGVNHVYGTGAVLPALAAMGEEMDQPYIRRAVDWILAHQNGDGGWGESCGSYVDPALRGVGASTASQTAWALMALLAAGEDAHPATQRGIRYLLTTQNGDGCWDEPYFTGTGFPGYGVGERVDTLPRPGERGHQGLDMPAGFMINYHLYRNTWPLMALGRYARLLDARGDAQRNTRTVSTDGAFPIAGRQEGSGNVMKSKSFCLQLSTQSAPEFIDITDWVCKCVAKSAVSNGFAVVYSKHTTAAVKINENEPLLLQDMAKFLEKMSPRNGGYDHNDFSIRTVNMSSDESPNGHAHVQHLLLGTSETVPVIDGLMQFGPYQSIFFIELDRARSREVMVQVVGE
jgi:squalene-hopene/tetraprenyl-beta-curcumene cyclase